MGMSGDYELAIGFGARHRYGSAQPNSAAVRSPAAARSRIDVIIAGRIAFQATDLLDARQMLHKTRRCAMHTKVNGLAVEVIGLIPAPDAAVARS